MNASVFVFEPDGRDLPPPWRGKLAVRVPGDREDETVRRQALAQDFLWGKGFPVPRMLGFGGPTSAVGHSFVLMEAIESRTDKNARPKLRDRLRRLGELHAELHEVDADGWPLAADGPLVDRRLHHLRTRARAAWQPKLDACLAWLEEHAEAVRVEEPRVLHTDFLGNVISTSTNDEIVIDWDAAEVGDRHDDVARSVNVFFVVVAALPTVLVRTILGGALWLVISPYRRRYEQRLPLDAQRLRYWAALQTLEYALLVIADDGSSNGPPENEEHAEAMPLPVRILCRYVVRRASDAFWRLAQGRGLAAATLGVRRARRTRWDMSPLR